MKKLISCLLILALVLSLSALGAGAFAEDAETVSTEFEEMGLTLELPKEFAASKGIIEPYAMGEIDPGVYLMLLYYVGMDPEEYDALYENDALTEEQEDALLNAMSVMGYVFAIDGGRTAADIIELFELQDVAEEDFIEVGKAEDVTFYLWLDQSEEEEYLAALNPEFAEEYSTLESKLPDVLKGSKFSVPMPVGTKLIGQVLSFETKDIDGNPVKSEDIFSQYEITMINVWATWCGPCLRELEELGEIDRRLADKDCAILGICIDADEVPDEAKELIKENKMDYLNILPFDDMDDALAIQGYPTSVFVGRDGAILAAPIIGVPGDISLYEDTIDALLAGESPAGDDSVNEIGVTVPSKNDKYNVFVSDSEGEPVKGVSVKFCSDETCTAKKTDEDGLVSFDAEEGQVYTVSILKVPEGVEMTDEEFQTLDVFSDTYIVLQKTAAQDVDKS